ncbi:hypothetical protein MSHI_09020 [Mycobacterium shinjukuense]|uniref:Uncharacterized protein n=1 Tax=Mycobacterium shinjukuense TaxID=398694 RepID=A0A7I7MLF2_9MYCO|nr:hypothetical protein MSHI_09020 [Mycobacterium shinjukuense]
MPRPPLHIRSFGAVCLAEACCSAGALDAMPTIPDGAVCRGLGRVCVAAAVTTITDASAAAPTDTRGHRHGDGDRVGPGNIGDVSPADDPIGSQGRGVRKADPFPHPPFNPCVRFSRTRLTDDLLNMVTLPSGSGWCHASGAGRAR